MNLSDANYSISANTLAGEAQLMVPGMNFSPVGLVGLGYFTSTITGHIDHQTAGRGSRWDGFSDGIMILAAPTVIVPCVSWGEKGERLKMRTANVPGSSIFLRS
jgi:hypothetical protein